VLLKGSRREALKGRVTARRLEPYSFAVPGQWQSRYRQLKVIGYSQAGPSTRKLTRRPELLTDLCKLLAGMELKVIQVIRNPFDPISLMMIRGNRSFENAIDHYFSYIETLKTLHDQLGDESLLPVKYEQFVSNPQEQLNQVCTFLGLETSDDYLIACADILYETPERSRDLVDWNEKWIGVLQEKIDQVDFLAGYTYDSE
jgi:hypothetical protein